MSPRWHQRARQRRERAREIAAMTDVDLRDALVPHGVSFSLITMCWYEDGSHHHAAYDEADELGPFRRLLAYREGVLL